MTDSKTGLKQITFLNENNIWQYEFWVSSFTLSCIDPVFCALGPALHLLQSICSVAQPCLEEVVAHHFVHEHLPMRSPPLSCTASYFTKHPPSNLQNATLLCRPGSSFRFKVTLLRSRWTYHCFRRHAITNMDEYVECMLHTSRNFIYIFNSILLRFSLLATTCRHLVAIQDRIRTKKPRFDQSLRTETTDDNGIPTSAEFSLVESAPRPVGSDVLSPPLVLVASCGWFSVPVMRYPSGQTKNPAFTGELATCLANVQ